MYARLIARHIGRHVPGNPAVIVRNQPGAGGRTMLNQLYAAGPLDGTAIGLANQGVAQDQALGDKGLKVDTRRLAWLGSPIDEVNVAWVWHTSQIKSIEMAKSRDVVVGATGPSSPTFTTPRILNALIGTRFKVVSGYPGSTEIDRAIEAGELDGRAAVGWSSLKITHDWVAAKKAVVLVQFGLRRAPDLPNVPLLQELATNDRDRGILEFLALGPAMGRPFCLPPGVPENRVAALRTAFEAALKDPALLKDAATGRLEINPVGYSQLEQLARRALSMPETSLDVLRTAMKK